MHRTAAFPSCDLQREGSAWQGGVLHQDPGAVTTEVAADLLRNAALGRVTQAISPAALATAWFDWSSHLLLGPARQGQLAVPAADSMTQWLHYASRRGSDVHGTPAAGRPGPTLSGRATPSA